MGLSGAGSAGDGCSADACNPLPRMDEVMVSICSFDRWGATSAANDLAKVYSLWLMYSCHDAGTHHVQSIVDSGWGYQNSNQQ
jgi:hypothetical protein